MLSTKSKFYSLPLTYQSVQKGGAYLDTNRILSDQVFDVPEIRKETQKVAEKAVQESQTAI